MPIGAGSLRRPALDMEVLGIRMRNALVTTDVHVAGRGVRPYVRRRAADNGSASLNCVLTSSVTTPSPLGSAQVV